MKFVALVSGGKDSCFNILHCIKNGHELAALANLHPPHSAPDELDSFLFQTVGYQAVALFGQCLGVPLYSRAIRGTSVVQTLEYEPRDADDPSGRDETEDLYALLREAQQKHPDIGGVSVGAILSTYQRTRVENVCRRLGLVCLAYLWQRAQDELLQEIVDSGMDARIIKTAAIGLDRSFLGQSLKDVHGRLLALNERFGLHLCGEGGEYETLVLDAPIFKKKLVLNMEESKIVDLPSENVSYIEGIKVELQDKPGYVDDGLWKDRLQTPLLLDERFMDLSADLSSLSLSSSIHVETIKTLLQFDKQIFFYQCQPHDTTADLQAQAQEVFKQLQTQLEEDSLDRANLAFISLQIADMAKFGQVNDIYSEYFFQHPNPPARACIQSVLPPGVGLTLAAVASSFKDRDDTCHEGLHVQGHSYWAPANIGPYSQAINASRDPVIYLAGQIGLIPASMTLLTDNVAKQAMLALQNLHRAQTAVDADSVFVSMVAYVTKSEYAQIASRVWASVYGGRPLLIAQVPQLPRGAAVEWVGMATNSQHLAAVSRALEEEDDDDYSEEYSEEYSEDNSEECSEDCSRKGDGDGDDDDCSSDFISVSKTSSWSRRDRQQNYVWPPRTTAHEVHFGYSVVQTMAVAEAAAVASVLAHASVTFAQAFACAPDDTKILQAQQLPAEIVWAERLFSAAAEPIRWGLIVRYN